MCTAFTHAFVALAAGKAAFPSGMPTRFWFLAMACSAGPDLDVGLHHYGVAYEDLWGHRGMMHSLLFAAIVAAVVTAWPMRRWAGSIRTRRWWALFSYFFIITASHGLLDACTNGGLGIAFLAPFSAERYFMPWNPIEVPTLGIRGMLSEYGLRVMLSELCWVWLPTMALTTPIILLRTWGRGGGAGSASSRGSDGGR